MEYKINGVPVRVHRHDTGRDRYIVGYRDTELYVSTLSEAEKRIRDRITEKLAVGRDNELKAYVSLRETGFSLSIPAEVYGEDNDQ